MTLRVDPKVSLRLSEFENVEKNFALKRRHVAVSKVLQQDLKGHVTGCKRRLIKKNKKSILPPICYDISLMVYQFVNV
jgi:hypothetical protein